MNRKRRILSAGNKLVIVQLYGKNVTQSEIARLLDLNKSIVSRVIRRHNECGSVKNEQDSRCSCRLGLNRYCSKMSRNPEMRRCRKLRKNLIKVELEECLNVLYNELFARKDISEG